MQFKLPTDTNARGAGTTSEQRTDTTSPSTPAQSQQIPSETVTQASPATPPSDSYWRQLFLRKSAEENAHKVENNKLTAGNNELTTENNKLTAENNKLTAENNELKAELDRVKRELRRAKIKIVMDEKAREQEAEKLQKADEYLEAAKKKIASVEEANSDWVLAFKTTEHQLWKANEETISAQRVRAALEKELEKTKLARAVLGKELEIKKRELCKSQSEKSLQGEFHETVKKRLLAVEDMLHASRRTSTTVASELHVTKQMLQDANDEISAGVSSQAALQAELEDTRGKLSKAVMEKKSSEVERTLLNSSLAIAKLHLSRVNATLSSCMAEKDALKRQLSEQSATVESAVSQVVDKIAALGHSIDGRLSAFENSVKSTIGELHNGVQSNGELMEGLRLQLSKADASTGVLEDTTAEESKQCVESSPEELEDQETSMPASLKLRFHKAVEESNRLTQAGSVAEDADADAAIQKGRHEFSEIFRDYQTHVVEKMVKEEKAVQEAINVAKRRITNHQDWLHRFRKMVLKDANIHARLKHGWLRLEYWKRSKFLIGILFDVEKQYDGVRDQFDTVLKRCDEMVKGREAVLDP